MVKSRTSIFGETMKTVPICKYCTHYRLNDGPNADTAQPVHQCVYNKQSPDIVTGYIEPIIVNCYEERSASSKCGVNGLNFVEKKFVSTWER